MQFLTVLFKITLKKTTAKTQFKESSKQKEINKVQISYN